ncbi:hypothetical protein Z043_123483 [Scleropages formosus]|uniref:Uncharacterized protein n=1 Tax=Scleropages formosus TaxID=113540 RepID=A0A0P7XZL0_SCLFO|nr:hypothetical protein Z043_123483 [Scleropages formosus]
MGPAAGQSLLAEEGSRRGRGQGRTSPPQVVTEPTGLQPGKETLALAVDLTRCWNAEKTGEPVAPHWSRPQCHRYSTAAGRSEVKGGNRFRKEGAQLSSSSRHVPSCRLRLPSALARELKNAVGMSCDLAPIKADFLRRWKVLLLEQKDPLVRGYTPAAPSSVMHRGTGHPQDPCQVAIA